MKDEVTGELFDNNNNKITNKLPQGDIDENHSWNVVVFYTYNDIIVHG